MTISLAKHLRGTHIHVNDDAAETITAGTTWKSPVIDISQAKGGAWSYDFSLTSAGSAVVTMTVRGGNFNDGTRSDLTDLEIASADLPSFTFSGSNQVFFNLENQNMNYAQIWFAVATADVTVDYAVAKVM